MSDHHDTNVVAHPKRSNRTLALVLVAIGILVLLNNVGLFSSALSAVLWPVGMIAVGVDLATAGQYRRRVVLGALVALAIFTPLVSGARFVERQRGTVQSDAGSELITLDEIESVRGEIGHTAGNINIRALQGDSDAVAQLNDGGRGSLDVFKRGSVGVLTLESSGWQAGNLDLQLTPRLPLDLQIDVGGGNAQPLDFSDLQLQRLDLSIKAGNAEVILPEQGVMEVTIDSRAGNVALEIPDDLAVRIEADAAFGKIDVDDDFIQQNGVYFSEDYEEDAPNRATIRIDVTAGNITIR